MILLVYQFHGGPLDGHELSLPFGVSRPSCLYLQDWKTLNEKGENPRIGCYYASVLQESDTAVGEIVSEIYAWRQ